MNYNAPHYASLSSLLLTNTPPLTGETKLQAHTKQGKITILYTLIFTFWNSGQEEKNVLNLTEQVFNKRNLLLIYLLMQLKFILSKYSNSATVSTVLSAVFKLWFCPAFWWQNMNTYFYFVPRLLLNQHSFQHLTQILCFISNSYFGLINYHH